MEASMAAVEQACRDIQRPATQHAALEVLRAFRSSPNSIPLCRFILERSQLLDARFQAAGTLREAMLREWVLLGPEGVRELRGYILRLVVGLVDAAAFAVVRSTLLATLAVLLKRSWVSETAEARMAFFQEVQRTLSAVGSASAQRTGVEFLEAVVSEFALATASRLGLPWQYHEHCHMDLESQLLRGFFTHAVSLAKQAVGSGAVQRGEDGGTCTACLSLIAAILGWEFRIGFGASPLSSYNSRRMADSVQVRLPPEWLALVMADDTLDWLLALLPALQSGHSAPSTLAWKARELLVLLCMMSADSFPRAPQGTPYREAHLKQCLRGLMLWIHPPDAALLRAAAQGEDELTDACRALSALAMTHRAAIMDRVGGSQVLQTLDKLTCGCIAAGGVNSDAAGTWVENCLELLMEMWLSLLQPEGSHSLSATMIPPAAVDAATHVFLAFMDASLKDFTAGAHEEAEDDDEAAAAAESRQASMASAAALARCNPTVTFPVLKDNILRCKQQLYTLATDGGDVSECLEQLYWLVSMTASCLADYCPGETALMPEAIIIAVHKGEVGVVEGLSHALLEVCALVLQEGAVHVLSPRLMESCVSALARWMDTYLFSEDEDFPEPLAALFGPGGNGESVLDMAVRVSTTCMASYVGEGELHREVCGTLLPSLVSRTPVCRHLVRLDSWKSLTDAFASRQPMLTEQLHQKVHRAIAHNLCRAAVGFSTADEAHAYITHVMRNTGQAVVEMTQQPDLKKDVHRPDVTQKFCCLLESLRGAARAATLATHAPLFAIFSSLLPALLVLHGACAADDNPLVVGLLLKLAADLVDAEVSYLKDNEIALFLEWVYKLVQQYSATTAKSLASVMASRTLRENQWEQAARELRALISLLTNLLQRDLVDLAYKVPSHEAGGFTQAGANGGQGHTITAAQVVLQGLNCILPLMSEDMLKYRKLGAAYFTLLSYLGDTFPQHVGALPPDQFSRLMRCLELGVRSDDPVVAQLALEALAGLGKWHLKEVRVGRSGLDTSNTAGDKTVAAHFMEVVLQRLLLEGNPAELVDVAADALLPLLLSQPQAFERLAGSIVQSHGDVKVQAAVHAAMADMLHANGLSGELSRQNKVKFRGNLSSMVASVRGLLLTR